MTTKIERVGFSIPTTVNVSKKRVADLLISAFEGGSNYWYRIEEFVRPPKRDFVFDAEHVYRHAEYPLSTGGALKISDLYGVDGDEKRKTVKVLGLPEIEEGLRVFARIYPIHFANFVAENDDAVTGDVFLQVCLFGEIVYG
jgi:hypothetical protein